MFEFIQGYLVRKTTDYCVIQVGGMGFRIYAGARTLSTMGEIGEEVTVYTYMQVKEDDISLYGFSSQEELNTFEILISVSGVGPKMAISVLSAMTPTSFSVAVATGDYKAISAGKGIGPKLAQRIILELKDKIKADIGELPEDCQCCPDAEGALGEAISAMVVLGYSCREAEKAVKSVYGDGLTAEELVKLALRKLMK